MYDSKKYLFITSYHRFLTYKTIANLRTLQSSNEKKTSKLKAISQRKKWMKFSGSKFGAIAFLNSYKMFFNHYNKHIVNSQSFLSTFARTIKSVSLNPVAQYRKLSGCEVASFAVNGFEHLSPPSRLRNKISKYLLLLNSLACIIPAWPWCAYYFRTIFFYIWGAESEYESVLPLSALFYLVNFFGVEVRTTVVMNGKLYLKNTLQYIS